MEMERVMERERERRKKNLVFKGVRKVEKGSMEEIKNIYREIGYRNRRD